MADSPAVDNPPPVKPDGQTQDVQPEDAELTTEASPRGSAEQPVTEVAGEDDRQKENDTQQLITDTLATANAAGVHGALENLAQEKPAGKLDRFTEFRGKVANLLKQTLIGNRSTGIFSNSLPKAELPQKAGNTATDGTTAPITTDTTLTTPTKK